MSGLTNLAIGDERVVSTPAIVEDRLQRRAVAVGERAADPCGPLVVAAVQAPRSVLKRRPTRQCGHNLPVGADRNLDQAGARDALRQTRGLSGTQSIGHRRLADSNTFTSVETLANGSDGPPKPAAPALRAGTVGGF